MSNKRKLTNEQIERLKRKKRVNSKKTARNIIFLIIAILAIIAIYYGVNAIMNNSDNETPPIESELETNDETSEETINEESETQEETEGESQVESEAEYTDNEIVSDSEIIRVGDTEETELITEIKNPIAESNLSDEEKTSLLSDMPELLRTMPERYPETEATVLEYYKYKDNDDEISILKDVKESQRYDRKVKLPYFNQWDTRWGFKQIEGEYMSVVSCGPTALSSIYTGLTGDTSKDPYTMAKYAVENGYMDWSGSYNTLFIDGANGLGLNGAYIHNSASEIVDALEEGKVVVALVRYFGIGDFTWGGHYITITELNDDGTVKILDPNSYVNTNKDWEIDRILSQTDSLMAVWK